MSAVSSPHEQHAGVPDPSDTPPSLADLEARLGHLENRATDAITSMDVGMKLAQDIRRFIVCFNGFADEQPLRGSDDLADYCPDAASIALSLIRDATASAERRVDFCMGASASLADASAQLRGALWCLNVAMRDLKAFSA
jgi:hypothetical protein